MEWTIKQANQEDITKLEAFLTEAGIMVEGLAESIEHYAIMESAGGELKACLGIEPAGSAGLLRSFVISPQLAQEEILFLFDRAFLTAKSKALTELYLVTNKISAISFFNRIGFEIISQSDLPEVIRTKKHIAQVISVDNSAIMKIIL